jgi:adenosylcobinamide-phosphate synthase
VHAGLRAWTVSVRRNFDAGKAHHGWVAWALGGHLPAALAAGIFWLLTSSSAGLRPCCGMWPCSTTLGFRQFSHHFTRIRDALEAGDERAAREALADWQQVDASELPRSEVVRHVIEYSVIWPTAMCLACCPVVVLSMLGLGPAGAVLYRMAEYLSRYWSRRSMPGRLRSASACSRAARAAWQAMDWLPARVTALGFAMVGSFEEAIDGWRCYAQRFPMTTMV